MGKTTVEFTEIFQILESVGGYSQLIRDVLGGTLRRVSILESAKPYLFSALRRDTECPIVLVCPRPEDARLLTSELRAFADDETTVLHFPETEILPFERMDYDPATTHSRLAVLSAIGSETTVGHVFIVTSSIALMQKTIGPDLFRRSIRKLTCGEDLSVGTFIQHCVRVGYKHSTMVEEPGTLCQRGGIIDIFPPGREQPCRIDLWGNRVDSIREFDTKSQRSTGHVDTLNVFPAEEILPSLTDSSALDTALRQIEFTNLGTVGKNRFDDELSELLAEISRTNASFYSGLFLSHTLLDHLSDDCLLAIDEISEIDTAMEQWEERVLALRRAKEEKKELPLGLPAHTMTSSSVSAQLTAHRRRLETTQYHLGTASRNLALPFTAPRAYQNEIQALANDITSGRLGKILISTQHSKRVTGLLRELGVGAIEMDGIGILLSEGGASISKESLRAGWSLRLLPSDQHPVMTFLTDSEVFGMAKRHVSRSRSRNTAKRSSFLNDLTPGSFVVHVDHGVGKFIGTSLMPSTGLSEGDLAFDVEYWILEYADGDRLYVPMDHLDRVSPYSGGADAPPTLTRLGTPEWNRVVARARASTMKLAIDLLALYADREVLSGNEHPIDTPWQVEMEDAFPYVETDDQYRAIDDVKRDMESSKPMDRLICGDVGFGKTEVALRAVFKAVVGGKQAAILVPTTILAQQHYDVFSERFAPFPIKIGVLSRFGTQREQNEIIANLKSGALDIVIGTHRLLQKDVHFNDLGLIVIDEEHRFGVNHKESLKDIRRDVDVLSLSATPIPRTLHMALAGVRDISNITTPPAERVAVRTFLAEDSDDLIREAIQRELDRGGQVYFLHNRVKSIHLVKSRIQALIPQARILVGHGQMPEDQLSRVMREFSEGRGDVLVCTSIIESGLDIGSVNTLIVDRSERFGLAQLYQIRGRIGRRETRAYAYFMVPQGRKITDTARRRLQTIVAATELGAGYHVAMRDLEIRGAGNILGAEQSGNIHAVGFDLYIRLLSEAVSDIQAASPDGMAIQERKVVVPQIDLSIAASIPEDLMPDLASRVGTYKRLSSIHSVLELDDLTSEFVDRFGRQLPDQLRHLLFVTRVRVLAERAHVEAIFRHDSHISLKLVDETGGAKLPLEKFIGHGVKVGNQHIRIPLSYADRLWGQTLVEALELLSEFRDRVATLPIASYSD